MRSKVLFFGILNLLFCLVASGLVFAQEEPLTGTIFGIVSSVNGDSAKVDALINGCRQKWKYAQYTEAKKYADAALMLAEKAKYHDGIAEADNQIGIVYWYVKDYDNALAYHLKALSLYEQSGNKNGISGVYNRIGHAYADMADYPLALEYFQKALNLDESLNDQNGISKNLNLIGFVHMKLSDFPKALDYYYKSLSLAEKINSKRGIAAVYHDIGEVYEKQDKADEALTFASKGLTLALEVGEKKLIEEAYEGLEKIFLEKRDYQSAHSTRLKYDKILSIEMSEDHAGKIKQMQMEYEFEKKQEQDRIMSEKEKEIEEIKLRDQKILTYISFAGVIITILFSLFIYRSYKEQRTANQKLKETQVQLIKSEKMAAFGEMASRVSHEIQNPLNFVNNFAALSKDFAHDVINAKSEEEKREAINNLIENLEKINHHGKRADSIIKQLQKHQRAGSAGEFFEENKK